ncbi:MAG TPA: DoxX family protein [Propionicimonas sp.]|jgi:uncharacterized membrane protein YphA (DoxX/SURF4 family)|nr:DoxX family protein [Propionicimonas sp.]
MSLLRFVARSMLASYFVLNGVKAFRDPESQVAAAEPIVDKLMPLATSALPRQVSVYLPEDATGFVKCTGAAQVIGGVSLATGLFRRLGAGVLAATMVPHVIASNPLGVGPADREQARAQLAKNVALLGGVLLAALDTEGKPGLKWRAKAQKQAVERSVAQTRATVRREAKLAGKSARLAAVEAKQTARRAAKSTGKAAREALESVR